MDQMTYCFGGGLPSCASCKRLLPMQQDNVMRMYFVAPPQFMQMSVDTIVCAGFINKEQQGAANG